MDGRRQKPYSSHGDGQFKGEDFLSLGSNVVFETGTLVFHPENILIGDNVYIGHNTILKGYHSNTMSIGDDTWVGQGCFFHSAGGIRIGKAVGIGPAVKILSSQHEDRESHTPVILNKLSMKEVVIEDGCDIGIGSIILPGVHIGQGSVIGAGSVVTRDVAPMSVVAGNPARLLRIRQSNQS